MRHAKVVTELLPEFERVVEDINLAWNEATEDILKIGARVALVRQLESLHGAVNLCQSNLGHLAVSDVRGSCEEYLWLKYLANLDSNLANQIFIMSALDGAGSVNALRNYVGDEVMVNELDSTESFMDALATSAPEYMANLAEIGKQLGWPRAKHVVPSAKWVAEQIDEDRPYEYLYSASSRAIHFPPGESMRRAWVDGDGMVTTRWGIHQTYLSDFALYQLTKLFLKTVSVALPWIDKGPKSSDDSDFFEFDIEKLKTSAPFPPCR